MEAGGTVDELVASALDEIREDAEFCPSLDALHERATPEVYAAALSLMASQDDDERELGVRILRELGSWTEPPYPYANEAVPALIEHLSRETNPRVLGWTISALGYNGRPEAAPHVLAFRGHPLQRIRFHVAAALPGLCDESNVAEVGAALLELSTDADADVRYYALHALVEDEIPADRTVVRHAAELRVSDTDQQVRVLAEEWLRARAS
jgi:hypothetical protein